MSADDIASLIHREAEHYDRVREAEVTEDKVVAAVERLLDKWRTDRLAYPLDDPRASVAFIVVKQCEEEMRAALAAYLGDQS